MPGAETIARALGGRRSGRGWIARCPSHEDGSPSLSIIDGDSAVIVKCFAGCSSASVIDALRSRGLWEGRTRPHGTASPPVPRQQDLPADDDAKRIASALALWAEAGPIGGSPAATHLQRRGVELSGLPPALAEALRWHPRCPFDGERRGCMIGLFTDAATGIPRAIHRTAITPAGEKVGRLTLGPMAGCVIRLWPDECVTDGLVLGEGVETVLAAATRLAHRGTLLRPAWAAATAGNMARFAVLPGIGSLTLLVDHDASRTGQRAAAHCADRWSAEGREVIRLTPRACGADFNNIAEAA
jgi:hypothetical protein